MFWRRTLHDELEACLDIDHTQMGHELVGRERALAAWQCLLNSPSFIGFTVASEASIGNHRILGFGSGVFVSNAFVSAELARPQPGINARIVASVSAGRPVVLTGSELSRANSSEGVNLVFLTAAVRSAVLNRQQMEDARTQLWLAWLHAYLGFRLRLVLREAASAEDIAYMKSHGVYGRAFTFNDFHRDHPGNGWNRDRALMVSTREDAAKRPGSIASILYAFREPELGLSACHQRLLEAATLGLTDEQLADALSLKLPAVKKRWAAVFDHVARVKPDLLVSEGRPEGPTRGRQKRHHVVAYVREHPEELRPWQAVRRHRSYKRSA